MSMLAVVKRVYEQCHGTGTPKSSKGLATYLTINTEEPLWDSKTPKNSRHIFNPKKVERKIIKYNPNFSQTPFTHKQNYGKIHI